MRVCRVSTSDKNTHSLYKSLQGLARLARCDEVLRLDKPNDADFLWLDAPNRQTLVLSIYLRIYAVHPPTSDEKEWLRQPWMKAIAEQTATAIDRQVLFCDAAVPTVRRCSTTVVLVEQRKNLPKSAARRCIQVLKKAAASM